MAISQEKPASSPQDQEFSKKNTWYSFTGSLYGAIGGAAFFGVLGKAASLMVDAAMGTAATGAALGTGLAVMGGLMVVGAACVYMAQREFTKLRCIQDEHLARKNAECALQKGGEAPEIVHEQNRRADGKQWAHVVQESSNHIMSLPSH